MRTPQRWYTTDSLAFANTHKAMSLFACGSRCDVPASSSSFSVARSARIAGDTDYGTRWG